MVIMKVPYKYGYIKKQPLNKYCKIDYNLSIYNLFSGFVVFYAMPLYFTECL